MSKINKDADLSQFTIAALLDAYWMTRTGQLDDPDWKQTQAYLRNLIITELLRRSPETLVSALLSEVDSNR